MDLLLLFTGFIMLGHQFFFLFGVIKIRKLLTTANVVQGVLPSLMVLMGLILGFWPLLILAFLLERSWIMTELIVKAARHQYPINFFFYLQLIGLGGSILVWSVAGAWAFAWFYASFSLISFIQWRKRVQHISS